MKYRVIFRYKENYPITTICLFFEVSRSGYYGYVKRMDNQDRDEPLARQIIEYQE